MKKAVLLSGPPGIGKTSAAHIVCREAGFQAVEVNASETRNKADKGAQGGVGGKLANVIKELSTNSTIGFGSNGRPCEVYKVWIDGLVLCWGVLLTDALSCKEPYNIHAYVSIIGDAAQVCLIMDEVDGMSGSDRGGVQDLIQTIQKSKIPIICICNDKYNMKLRSLRNHTLELDFRCAVWWCCVVTWCVWTCTHHWGMGRSMMVCMLYIVLSRLSASRLQAPNQGADCQTHV